MKQLDQIEKGNRKCQRRIACSAIEHKPLTKMPTLHNEWRGVLCIMNEEEITQWTPTANK